MRLTYEYDWREPKAEYTVAEAVDHACDDQLSEGRDERLHGVVKAQGELLGRLVERLVDNDLLSGDDLRAVLGSGWRVKE